MNDSKPLTIAFDIYGTLINPHGLVDDLKVYVGEQTLLFSKCWREKQLEYSFRRGLMQDYQSFAVCTKDALDYTCRLFKTPLTDAVKSKLLARYRELPAFDGVAESLALLKSEGVSMYAFSNGLYDDVANLMTFASLDQYLDGIVSVDTVKSFKPAPKVYQHFLDSAGAQKETTWLVSSNPFDILGAKHAGWRAAWINRGGESVFDPWDKKPDIVLNDLLELSVKRLS